MHAKVKFYLPNSLMLDLHAILRPVNSVKTSLPHIVNLKSGDKEVGTSSSLNIL